MYMYVLDVGQLQCGIYTKLLLYYTLHNITLPTSEKVPKFSKQATTVSFKSQWREGCVPVSYTPCRTVKRVSSLRPENEASMLFRPLRLAIPTYFPLSALR